jgi:hypothetical protein
LWLGVVGFQETLCGLAGKLQPSIGGVHFPSSTRMRTLQTTDGRWQQLMLPPRRTSKRHRTLTHMPIQTAIRRRTLSKQTCQGDCRDKAEVEVPRDNATLKQLNA